MFVSDVAQNGPQVWYDVAADGALTYLSGWSLTGSKRSIVWIDPTGDMRPSPITPRHFEWPVISRDGKRLAIRVATTAANHIWVYNLDASPEDRDGTPITSEGANSYPLWSPDGLSVVYGSSEAPNPVNIFRQAISGASGRELILKSPRDFLPNAWAPDGRLLYVELDGAEFRLHALSMTDRTSAELLHFKVPVDARSFSVSPDGRWLLYQSRESGQFETYVRPFPNVTGGRIKVSPSNGPSPMWHPSGNAIVFVDGQRLMRADVETKPTFRVVKIARIGDAPGIGAMAIAPDGRVMRLQPVGPTQPELRVLLNWADDARSVLPGR
jgi:serine/threonine-protein kinase